MVALRWPAWAVVATLVAVMSLAITLAEVGQQSGGHSLTSSAAPESRSIYAYDTTPQLAVRSTEPDETGVRQLTAWPSVSLARQGATARFLAAEATTAAAARPFVIGEDTARVNAAAKAFDAETYPGYSNPDGLAEGSPELGQARLSDNSQWIGDRMAAGQRGIDIGPAPGRANFPGATSDAYSIELYELENASYGNLIQPYDLPVSLGAPR